MKFVWLPRTRKRNTLVDNDPQLAELCADLASGFPVRIVRVHGLLTTTSTPAGPASLCAVCGTCRHCAYDSLVYRHSTLAALTLTVALLLKDAIASPCASCDRQRGDSKHVRVDPQNRYQSRGEPESRGIIPRNRASVIVKSSCRFRRYARAASSDSAATQSISGT